MNNAKDVLKALQAASGADDPEQSQVDEILNWCMDCLEEGAYAEIGLLFDILDVEKLTVAAILCPLAITNPGTTSPEVLAQMPQRAAYSAKVLARLERERPPEDVEDLMRGL